MEQPFELTLTLETQEYQPGQAVVAHVTMRNLQATTQTLTMLDHTSVVFSLQEVGRQAKPTFKTVEPVWSPKEQTGTLVQLGPNQIIERLFLLTTVTFERGTFALLATHQQESNTVAQAIQRIYGRAARFTVAGEKAAMHRTLDGLMTRADARALAAAQHSAGPEQTEFLLVRDEKGFLKYWINVLGEAGGNNEPVGSYFIDPYRGVIWRRAQPFTQADIKNHQEQSDASSKAKEELLNKRWE